MSHLWDKKAHAMPFKNIGAKSTLSDYRSIEDHPYHPDQFCAQLHTIKKFLTGCQIDCFSHHH